MATGWTWEYVWETMTFQRLEKFNQVWTKTPPPFVSLFSLDHMLKHFLGYKKKETNAELKKPPAFTQLPDIEE